MGTPYVAQVEEKTKTLDAGGLHGSQEDEGTGDVVHVVLEGVLDGLSHVDEGGKVNHGVKAALHQEGIHDGGVSQVALDQFHLRVHEGSDVAVHHVVQHSHVSADFDELAHRVGTNISGAAGYKYFHDLIKLLLGRFNLFSGKGVRTRRNLRKLPVCGRLRHCSGHL